MTLLKGKTEEGSEETLEKPRRRAANSAQFRDFCYAYFSWMGRGLSKIFRGIDSDLDAAYMRIPSEVYLSIVGFVALLTLAVPPTLLLFMLAGLWPASPFFILLIPLSLLIPLIVMVVGGVLPKMAASNRVSSLKIEIPYASMYISVMASGGLSPYESLLRMQRTDLLPEMRKEVARIEAMVRSTGVDPVTAMERAAKVINLNEYKELLLGYASTVRTGGDTLHYLFNQTNNMFRRFSTRIRSMGESMGMLMEAYTIVGILGVLGLFLMFVMSVSLPSMGMSFSGDQFFLFSFVLLPVMSFVFIYFSDVVQISYPVSSWKAYLFLLIFLPVGLILGTQLVLPYFIEDFPSLLPLTSLISFLRMKLNFAEGTEAALGLTITLIVIAVPGMVSDRYFASREGSLQQGISAFLRDMVETRKSGLSPERCIEALSTRDYRGFSPHLRRISTKIGWGYPLRQIYDEFKGKVRNWLALINIYLLIDTIEVGGGSEESLETLAEFSESTKNLEDEKKSMLMPLTIVPYIGGALLTATTVMFLQFFTGLSALGLPTQSVILYRVLMPPLVLHSFLLGIVTGKISSGRVSAGFKHAILMVLVAVGGVWMVSNTSFGMGGGLI